MWSPRPFSSPHNCALPGLASRATGTRPQRTPPNRFLAIACAMVDVSPAIYRQPDCHLNISTIRQIPRIDKFRCPVVYLLHLQFIVSAGEVILCFLRGWSVLANWHGSKERSFSGWGCSACAWVFNPSAWPPGKSLEEMKTNFEARRRKEFESHACARTASAKPQSTTSTLKAFPRT
jgi:rubredoxin